MIEIYPRLYVGNEIDERIYAQQPGWRILSAAKEPFHRAAVGYAGRALPKNHPQYLMARMGVRLALNLVDAPDPAYISVEIVDAALEFIKAELDRGMKVLVHCNKGESRGPTIGLLYLAGHDERFGDLEFDGAEEGFRAIYPAYKPGSGMRGFAEANWGRYVGSPTGTVKEVP